ncbi:LemA family protein [Thiomicrorhabdus aquaedulcis]|uniref:LemA family protein n=1 Tax=Thiomicrorhabdus aquaedulcis TaxID=2211106 RepID=UPI000FD7C1FB|nr:LemA family protein [Thiomicrorhabdus aquaedulcis]
MSVSWMFFGVLLLALALYAVVIYNTLVRLKNQYLNGFAQIEVQLKRRYDLIPNMIEVAKKAMAHERETLEAVTLARNEALALLNAAGQHPGDVNAMHNLGAAQSTLSDALARFNLVVEAYPDLKTNQNMLQLTEELTSTENRVSFARQAFNDAVMSYNQYRQSFPPIALASVLGHPTDATLLEFADSAQIQVAPAVRF